MIHFKQFAIAMCVGGIGLSAVGCDFNADRSAYFKAPAADATPNPGGAPTYGVPSGMGFYTGDAAQTGGMGSGLMGFNGTGSTGTSGAVSDISTLPPLASGERPLK